MITLIYFPMRHEPRKYPYIIVADGQAFDGSYRGNPYLDELAKGKFAFYDARRCQPYSDRLWLTCMRWIENQRTAEEQFKKLMHGNIPPELCLHEFDKNEPARCIHCGQVLEEFPV